MKVKHNTIEIRAVSPLITPAPAVTYPAEKDAIPPTHEESRLYL